MLDLRLYSGLFLDCNICRTWEVGAGAAGWGWGWGGMLVVVKMLHLNLDSWIIIFMNLSAHSDVCLFASSACLLPSFVVSVNKAASDTPAPIPPHPHPSTEYTVVCFFTPNSYSRTFESMLLSCLLARLMSLKAKRRSCRSFILQPGESLLCERARKRHRTTQNVHRNTQVLNCIHFSAVCLLCGALISTCCCKLQTCWK